MSPTVVNRVTGERLTVHLDLGNDLWLRNAAGDIEHAKRDQLPAELWRFDDATEEGNAPLWLASIFDLPAPPPEVWRPNSPTARLAP